MLKLHITTKGRAFQGRAAFEVAAILRRAATAIETDPTGTGKAFTLIDTLGQNAGIVRFDHIDDPVKQDKQTTCLADIARSAHVSSYVGVPTLAEGQFASVRTKYEGDWVQGRITRVGPDAYRFAPCKVDPNAARHDDLVVTMDGLRDHDRFQFKQTDGSYQ